MPCFLMIGSLSPSGPGIVRVLLADNHHDRAEAVSRRLLEAGATEILQVPPGASLLEAVAENAPDVIIVDMARPDRDSLDGIRQVASQNPRPIVMFVDHDDASFMEDAIEAGVSSYNVVGSALPDVKPVVQAAVAMFRRYQKMASELRRAETTLSEKTLIHQAKLLIMRQRRIGEPEAHRWLRRHAMNRGRRMADIAAEVLQGERKAD
jgi:response regulator NasT